MLMKSPVSEKFLNDWIALNNLSKELITDKRSIVANKSGFKEHRHDQSTFSLTAKRYPHTEISWKETHVEDGNCLNVDIQNITRQELLENLKEGVLVTPNLDHLIKLQKDKEFYDVYQKSEWVVALC